MLAGMVSSELQMVHEGEDYEKADRFAHVASKYNQMVGFLMSLPPVYVLVYY